MDTQVVLTNVSEQEKPLKFLKMHFVTDHEVNHSSNKQSMQVCHLQRFQHIKGSQLGSNRP